MTIESTKGFEVMRRKGRKESAEVVEGEVHAKNIKEKERAKEKKKKAKRQRRPRRNGQKRRLHVITGILHKGTD